MVPRELCPSSSSSSCVVSPHANLFLLTLPPVHGVYNAGTDPLGVVFVILLLSSPRRRQRRHAVHGPSGVVLARSLQPSYNANTAPLGVVFVGGTATA